VETVVEFDVIVEIPQGSRNKYEIWEGRDRAYAEIEASRRRAAEA